MAGNIDDGIILGNFFYCFEVIGGDASINFVPQLIQYPFKEMNCGNLKICGDFICVFNR